MLSRLGIPRFPLNAHGGWYHRARPSVEHALSDDVKATLRVDAEDALRLRTGIATVATPACLVLIYGADLGRRYELAAPLSIGRDPSNGIVVDTDDVSRQHAFLAPEESDWTISDLGSTNGTHVNESRVVGARRLHSGDFVRVGGAIFKYIGGGGNLESQFYDLIYRLTIYDGLTGVHNRRYLDEFLEREMARSRRHNRPLGLAILDIDHFKAVNDSLGHLAGDAVLRDLAGRVQKMVRREQLLARYGGEEFALVMPENDAGRAWMFCQKICRAVAAEQVMVEGKPVALTVSIGVAIFTGEMDLLSFVGAADSALYKAKSEGRNRVVSFEAES
jgi:two-component system cell cycle response regulator